LVASSRLAEDQSIRESFVGWWQQRLTLQRAEGFVRGPVEAAGHLLREPTVGGKSEK